MSDTFIYKSVLVTLTLILAYSHTVHSQQPSSKDFFKLGVQNNVNAEYSEAIDAFTYAIELDPQFAEAHHELGNAYFNLHRYTEAYDSYKKAVEYSPKSADAHFSLAIVASMLSKHNTSIKHLKKVIQLSPRHSKAYFSLGNMYSELNQYEDAIEAYRGAVKIRPTFAEARYHLGLSYIKLRKKLLNSAKNEQKRLRKLDSDLAEDLLLKINNKKN